MHLLLTFTSTNAFPLDLHKMWGHWFLGCFLLTGPRWYIFLRQWVLRGQTLSCYISFHNASRVPEILQRFAKSYHSEDITVTHFSTSIWITVCLKVWVKMFVLETKEALCEIFEEFTNPQDWWQDLHHVKPWFRGLWFVLFGPCCFNVNTLRIVLSKVF